MFSFYDFLNERFFGPEAAFTTVNCGGDARTYIAERGRFWVSKHSWLGGIILWNRLDEVVWQNVDEDVSPDPADYELFLVHL